MSERELERFLDRACRGVAGSAALRRHLREWKWNFAALFILLVTIVGQAFAASGVFDPEVGGSVPPSGGTGVAGNYPTRGQLVLLHNAQMVDLDASIGGRVVLVRMETPGRE